MENAKIKIRKFNKTSFVNEVCKIIPIDKKILQKDIKDYVWPRLDFLRISRGNDNRYFVLEEDYIETEWKDMISIHYINTSYHVENTVIRVHLFLASTISENVYAGFFTLRKIDEARIMLSYIYPNWERVRYNSQSLCIMSYKKAVHIAGERIEFSTYPLFVQDNITVACAQANIISMTQYLHHKFDYKKVRIAELNSSYTIGKTKLYPTEGLAPTQMLQIFCAHGISIRYAAINAANNKKVNEEERRGLEEYRQYIDYSVESAIPVLLGISIKDEAGRSQKHVVQIIGHTQQNRQQYVIYDDSGYFLKQVLHTTGFVGFVEWTRIAEIIKMNKSFILYPIHEKVYLFFEDIKNFLLHAYNSEKYLKELEIQQKSNIDQTRYILADNKIVKKFLKESVLNRCEIEAVKEEINRLLNCCMTHYVWYCEIPLEEGFFIFIANPTYSQITSKNIFYNENPIYTNERLPLLAYK